MTTWTAVLEGGPFASYECEVLGAPAAVRVDGGYLTAVDADVVCMDAYVLLERDDDARTLSYVWPHTANDLWCSLQVQHARDYWRREAG